MSNVSEPDGAVTPTRGVDAEDPHVWIAEAIRTVGAWVVHERLMELKRQTPTDLKLRGYTELVRTVVVRDFLARPKGTQAVPKLTAEFLNNFDRFNLTAQEGFLVSLIDGRMNVQKLLVLSPFDHFTTLFNLARLEHQKAITVPSS